MIGCDNVWSCCSSASPCNVNQGDCDTNEDCIGDLVCGISNCIGSEFPVHVDCCENQGTYFPLDLLIKVMYSFRVIKNWNLAR